MNILIKKESWPRKELFHGKTQNSQFGSDPVFSDLAFKYNYSSLTYVTLVLTVMSSEKPMYEFTHDLSSFDSIHGWVDLKPLTDEKPNPPPQLNLSLEFHFESGPLHLLLLKPYMSDKDLQEVARQSEVKQNRECKVPSCD